MTQFVSSTEVTSLLIPLLLLLPLIFFILKYFKLSFSPKSTPPLPPGPFLWTFLGKNPHITLAKLARTYGPLMTLKLGTLNVIVGSSKAAAVEILKTHDDVLCGRYVSHASPAKSNEMNQLSMGFTLECDEGWRSKRSICQLGLFSGVSIESQASVRERKAMEMLRFVAQKEGEVVRFRNIAFGTILSMISNIFVSKDLLGFDQECANATFSGYIRKALESTMASNISDYFPFMEGLDLQGLRKESKEISTRMITLWEDAIKERRQGKKSTQQDFLDILIDAGFADDHINGLFLELFSAGTDASSSTIEWTMAELIKNPKIMKKLRQELDSQIGKSDEVKESTLDQLTYLQACVKETLRLHPPGPLLLPHRATETCKVLNYTVPKDTPIAVNFWAIGRDPEYWEDPLEYKPERFLNSNLDFKGNHFDYFPFGSGRRMCPGMPMAAKQVPLLLACLVRFFDWSLPTGTDPNNLDMSEKYALTIIKAQPLLLIPKARKLIPMQSRDSREVPLHH